MLFENTQVVLLILFTHVVVAIFLISIQSGNRLSNRLLGTLLLLIAVDLSNFIFPTFYDTRLNLDMTRANIALFVAPTLYFYVRAVIHRDFMFRWQDVWHSLPFLMACLILLPNFYLVDNHTKLAFYDALHSRYEIIAISVLAHGQILLYLVVCFRVLAKHRRVLTDNLSDITLVNNTWLLRFLQAYSINFLFIFLRNTTKFTEYKMVFSVLNSVMLLITLSFGIWILFQSLRKPELFLGIHSTLKTSEELIQQAPVEKTQAIDNQTFAEDIAKLKQHIAGDKPYLDPTLTIDTLAQNVNLTVGELSLIMNRHMGQHFFELINEYRIKEAAAQLSDPELSQKTVLEILYDVGFNSKSSFNTAFKKQMQMTPTQYRQSHRAIT